MTRIDVIQKLIDAKRAKTYLEIGVEYQACFLQIKAPRKIAVDPKLIFWDKKTMAKRYLKNLWSNIFNKYYEMTSDDFFRTQHQLFGKRKIDVAFIDGLHEYNQVIRDVNNCLDHLTEGGVIVLHDCNPKSEEEAFPSDRLPAPDRSWMGDVWKAVVYFRSCRPDVNIFVLDADAGLGIMTRRKPDSVLPYTAENIENLSYRDLERNRAEMLNLKSTAYLEEFLKTLKSYRGS